MTILKKKRFILGLVLVLSLALGACNKAESPDEPKVIEGDGKIEGPSEEARILPEDYPLVDGSTATLPLMAQVYSRMTQVPLEEAESRVQASKTSEAWRNIGENAYRETDLLFVYEPPAQIREEVDFDLLEVDEIGLDSLVFLVNKDNPVESLSQEELRKIYKGEIRNWKEVGGEDGEIHPFQRNLESGSQTLFLKLLMKGESPMEAPKDLIEGSMSGIIEKIASYDNSKNALGFSVYYYAELMYNNPDLKILAVDGVEPGFETIQSGAYPLNNPFYGVIKKSAGPESYSRLIRDFILSEEGKDLMKEAGYIPVK